MAKTFTTIFGTILILLGFLGFASNPLIGNNAFFVTDSVHNLIHLIFGAILLIVVLWSDENSAFWLEFVGMLIFLLGLIGLLATPSSGGMLLGIAATNGASNWMHIIGGAAIFFAGKYGKDAVSTPYPQAGS